MSLAGAVIIESPGEAEVESEAGKPPLNGGNSIMAGMNSIMSRR